MQVVNRAIGWNGPILISLLSVKTPLWKQISFVKPPHTANFFRRLLLAVGIRPIGFCKSYASVRFSILAVCSISSKRNCPHPCWQHANDLVAQKQYKDHLNMQRNPFRGNESKVYFELLTQTLLIRYFVRNLQARLSYCGLSSLVHRS